MVGLRIKISEGESTLAVEGKDRAPPILHRSHSTICSSHRSIMRITAQTVRIVDRHLRIDVSRQIDREDAPRTGQITNAHFTVHCFETAPTDIEPQSESRAVRGALNEGQHEFFAGSFGKTAAMILDFNRNAIFRCITAKPNLGVTNRKLEGVMQQVSNCRREHLRVSKDLDVL